MSRFYGVEVKAPCYKCEDRIPGCHSECEKYTAFKARVDELKEENFRQKQKVIRTMTSDHEKNAQNYITRLKKF